MKIEVYPDAQAVAQEAAWLVAAQARAAVAERGSFVMAVSGGRTPWLMLRALADEEVPWNAVHVVQVDERVAPAGDSDRNLTHLRESLLEHAPLRPEQIYAMPVESSTLEAAAAQYAVTLQTIAGSPPVLDVVHLGLGPDGHTASLVPGDPVLKVREEDVALTRPYQGRRRMTLTYPIINRSRLVLWLVTGREKAGMLARLQAGDILIPAGWIRADRAVILADRAAAGQVDNPDTEETIRPDSSLGIRAIKQGEHMRIGIAADHGGFELKEDVRARLAAAGHSVVDFGANSLNPGDDYPDFVIPLARAVAAGELERGIAICGSGVGASVCANKVHGVRAALINDHFSARQGVEDDHLNIICLGGRTEGPMVVWDLVQTFLAAEFSQAERHLRRLGKVAALEEVATSA
jgi:6-phosphogluconolactonase